MADVRTPYFRTAITAIFKNWSALQLCVAHQGGGPQSKEKAEWMEEVTENWFHENRDIQAFEVEEFLGEILETEFQLQIDDGSLGEVSRKVCESFTICTSQPEAVVLERLKALPRCDLSKCLVEEGEEMEEDGGEVVRQVAPSTPAVEELAGMEIGHREPEIDEEGFQMVSNKKGGRKK